MSVMLLSIACAPREDPFVIGERKAARGANPTPTAALMSGGVQVPVAAPTAVKTEYSEQELKERLYKHGIGTIRLGDWKDKSNAFYNNILGYIIVYGYDYTVEIVDLPPDGYTSALVKGEIDVMMDMSDPDSPGWYQEYIDSGVIIGAGALLQSKPDSRIGVHASLKERAPEVLELLGKVTPADEELVELESKITGGRTGVKENVAALMFLKRHEEIWTRWTPPSVVEKVKAAISSGKTSLKNVKCLALGGMGSVGSPSCTPQ